MYVDRKPELQELYLAHHGVKGMKWYVRKRGSSDSRADLWKKENKKNTSFIARHRAKKQFKKEEVIRENAKAIGTKPISKDSGKIKKLSSKWMLLDEKRMSDSTGKYDSAYTKVEKALNKQISKTYKKTGIYYNLFGNIDFAYDKKSKKFTYISEKIVADAKIYSNKTPEDYALWLHSVEQRIK